MHALASPARTANALAVHLILIVQLVHSIRLLFGLVQLVQHAQVALSVRVVDIAQLFLCMHLLVHMGFIVLVHLVHSVQRMLLASPVCTRAPLQLLPRPRHPLPRPMYPLANKN